MLQYRFSKPDVTVEVRKSKLDQPDPKNPYKIFECLCRRPGRRFAVPRKTYNITATSQAAAARMAYESFIKDCLSNGGKE